MNSLLGFCSTYRSYLLLLWSYFSEDNYGKKNQYSSNNKKNIFWSITGYLNSGVIIFEITDSLIDIFFTFQVMGYWSISTICWVYQPFCIILAFLPTDKLSKCHIQCVLFPSWACMVFYMNNEVSQFKLCKKACEIYLLLLICWIHMSTPVLADLMKFSCQLTGGFSAHCFSHETIVAIESVWWKIRELEIHLLPCL